MRGDEVAAVRRVRDLFDAGGVAAVADLLVAAWHLPQSAAAVVAVGCGEGSPVAAPIQHNLKTYDVVTSVRTGTPVQYVGIGLEDEDENTLILGRIQASTW